MENTVASEAIDTGVATEQYVDDAAEIDELNLSELMASDESGEGTVAEPQDVDAQPKANERADDAQTPMYDQKAIDAIIGQRLGREREKFMRSPEYIAGELVLKQRMQRDNIGAEEALKRIRDDQVDERAELYAKDPKAFYRDYINGQNAPQPVAETDNALARELITAHQMHALPQNFDPNRDVDETFVAYHHAFGLSKAVENWKSRNSAATAAEVQRQKTAPQPMKIGGNPVNTPSLDFGSMSYEDFARIDKQIEQSLRMGRKVRF